MSDTTPYYESAAMNYDKLLKKYQALVMENESLKKEIIELKALICVEVPGVNSDENTLDELEDGITETEATGQEYLPLAIDNMADPLEKIKLFMSLFKGRDDVYAKRWENYKKGTAGYSPVCLNEWKHGLCHKRKTPCNRRRCDKNNR